ncbi:di-heme oxidoredictase family protein [Sulfitobacter guttiformis]|uniref:di-heme oxidoredictase family protein n=1 Tax=Sulfitobacter guttiformis TaxID=74349 RepID=UPI00046AB687|nr:di-heme oxidoredictase family protein [Sulfitobacter guttiformis]
MTRSLAGVGSTGPWLHDGRATTLDEAIPAHAGEAAASRHAYAAMSEADAARIVTYLESLILFSADDAH